MLGFCGGVSGGTGPGCPGSDGPGSGGSGLVGGSVGGGTCCIQLSIPSERA
jgi:hypothetical protein